MVVTSALRSTLLPTTLESAIAQGLVREHGRFMELDEQGAIVNDADMSRVELEWRPAVESVRQAWLRLPPAVDTLRLFSVYLRGSLPRGLGLPGLADLS